MLACRTLFTVEVAGVAVSAAGRTLKTSASDFGTIGRLGQRHHSNIICINASRVLVEDRLRDGNLSKFLRD